MKQSDKVLTYEQARELKWFARNILGTRQEFYKWLDAHEKYKKRIDRLATEAELIMKFCEENGIKDGSEELAEAIEKEAAP